MSTRNHEITTEQKLLDVRGNIAEPGWSRRQLQKYRREDIKAPGFRIKEWDYYLIVGDDFAVACTISDDGYVGLQSVSLLNFAEGWEHTETILDAFPMGKLHMPANSSEGDVVYDKGRLKLQYRLEQGTRHIICEFQEFYKGKDFTCDIVLQQPDMDSMVIATPWPKRAHFYYNQKINCMRASGWAEYDGKRYEFHPDRNFGALDWGRGVWTYDNTWLWGSGNCDIEGHAFGFNIGYGFGDTRAATENVIFYDGVAHKLDDVTFHIPEDSYMKPWNFSSSDGRFEMDFEPILDRAANLDYKVIVSDQHQVFGKMTGTAVLDDGTPIHIKDVLCFAEKVHNRY
ncbi:MAG: DUF2804 domain-containing protein [Lachnospiraceae bacterium]|nr:DUF2804 domain-containing protein [Lachnospiraceae bacterium]